MTVIGDDEDEYQLTVRRRFKQDVELYFSFVAC